jgi:phage-related protein
MYREVIFYDNYFLNFYNKQPPKVKDKINWTLGIIRDLEKVPDKYLKHLCGTDLYEVRVSQGNNIFRIFCFFDKGKIVILLNAFRKKSQKTPREEIKKAINLKKLYYEEQKK